MSIRKTHGKAEAKVDSWVRAVGWKLQRLADSQWTMAFVVIAAVAAIVLFGVGIKECS